MSLRSVGDTTARCSRARQHGFGLEWLSQATTWPVRTPSSAAAGFGELHWHTDFSADGQRQGHESDQTREAA